MRRATKSGRVVPMLSRAHQSQHQGRLAEPVCARPPKGGPQGRPWGERLRLREDCPLGKHARSRVPWGRDGA